MPLPKIKQIQHTKKKRNTKQNKTGFIVEAQSFANGDTAGHSFCNEI